MTSHAAGKSSAPVSAATFASPSSVAKTSKTVTLQDQHPHGIIPQKTDPLSGKPVLDASGAPVYNYDLAIPVMLLNFFPTGILGLGLTALLASFMSGMAGDVTAFNTVWTYEHGREKIVENAGDRRPGTEPVRPRRRHFEGGRHRGVHPLIILMIVQQR